MGDDLTAESARIVKVLTRHRFVATLGDTGFCGGPHCVTGIISVGTHAEHVADMLRNAGMPSVEREYRVNRSRTGVDAPHDGMTLPQAQAWLRTDLTLGYGPLVHIEQRERQIGEWSDWTDTPAGGDPITRPGSVQGGER